MQQRSAWGCDAAETLTVDRCCEQKQGIEASKLLRQKALDAGQPDPGEIGLGALSAAVSNLSSLIGIVSPIAWGCEPPRSHSRHLGCIHSRHLGCILDIWVAFFESETAC